MVELGKSKVPLEEDLIKEKREFVKTWLEWIPDGNAEQVLRFGSVGATQLDLFVVPQNFTLFITSAWIHVRGTTAADGGRLVISGFANDRADFLQLFIAAANTHTNLSQTYNMPYKIQEGLRINLAGLGVGPNVTGGFMGFLLHKKISLR